MIYYRFLNNSSRIQSLSIVSLSQYLSHFSSSFFLLLLLQQSVNFSFGIFIFYIMTSFGWQVSHFFYQPEAATCSCEFPLNKLLFITEERERTREKMRNRLKPINDVHSNGFIRFSRKWKFFTSMQCHFQLKYVEFHKAFRSFVFVPLFHFLVCFFLYLFIWFDFNGENCIRFYMI